MSDEDLIAWDRQGLIPGPKESEDAFCERANAQQKAMRVPDEAIPRYRWDWPKERLEALFGFSPTLVSASYSSKGLLPWEAAATWIDVKRVYTIRIKKGRLISKLVDPSEILAHEAVHAARAGFDGDRFEEIFAYLTSRSKLRSLFGPLLKKPIEGLFLVGLMVAGSAAEILESSVASFFYGGSVLFTSFLFLRLLRARRVLEQAAKYAACFLREPKKVKSFLFRLSEEEILCLALQKHFLPKEGLRRQLLKQA